MKRRAESLRRPPPRRQEVPGMADVVKQLERSGRIYFAKTLTQTAIRTRNSEKTAMLALPTQFVRDHGDKIEQWVILRTHVSHGRSGRPWTVRLSVSEAGRALFCGGFYAFVTDNRLTQGDSLVFVLQEGIRSEFEVYAFSGSQGGPLCPEDGDSTSSDDSHSSFPSPSHHHHEHKKACMRDTRKGKATPYRNASHFDCHRVPKKVPTSDTRTERVTPSPPASHFDYHRVPKKVPTRDTKKERVTPSPPASHFDYHRVHKKEPTSDSREGRAAPSQFASHFDYRRVHKESMSDTWDGRNTPLQFGYHWKNHSVLPFFRKRLTASNIGRSDRHPRTHSGQFEFPERFLRAHARMIQTPVKLQGIHEDSRTHVIACRLRPGTRLRADLVVTGWSRFVKENRLEKGQELLFTLMADSYFLVRQVY